MSVQERKERERAVRERLIVATARELAEQQGWDAVTTRRLAERIAQTVRRSPQAYSELVAAESAPLPAGELPAAQ
ncbi:TetR family transcriptional regulator, partial [Streptomyces sp. NPDC001215]